MLIAVVPLVLAVLGLILYLAMDGKPSTIGLWTFVVSAFWLVYSLAGRSIHVG